MLGNGRYSVMYTTVVPSDIQILCTVTVGNHIYMCVCVCVYMGIIICICMFMGIYIYIYSWEIMYFHGNNIYMYIHGKSHVCS